MMNHLRALGHSRQIWMALVVGLGIVAAMGLFRPFGRVTTQPGGAQHLPPAQLARPDSPPYFSFSIDKPGGGLLRPMTVIESATGDVYVADSGHAVVQVFDHDGKFLRTIGQPASSRPPGDGELIYPVGLAMDDAAGQLYVADVQAGHIVIFSPNGDFVGTFGGDTISSPVGLLYHNDTLIVNDIGAQHVLVLDAHGNVVVRYTADEVTERLSFANYSALSPNGQLAVADSNNNRVVIFSSDGAISETLGTKGDEMMLMPRGIGYDPLGRLHVVSVFRHQVLVFDRSLALVFAYGERGDGDGQFNFPNGLWISQDRVYVADRENNRVQVWQLASAQ